MNKILSLALMEHLKKHAHDQERMNEYYQAFKESEEKSVEALKNYADLVFLHGVNEDAELNSITPSTVVGIGLTLQHLTAELALADYGRDNTSYYLDIIQGGE